VYSGEPAADSQQRRETGTADTGQQAKKEPLKKERPKKEQATAPASGEALGGGQRRGRRSVRRGGAVRQLHLLPHRGARDDARRGLLDAGAVGEQQAAAPAQCCASGVLSARAGSLVAAGALAPPCAAQALCHRADAAARLAGVRHGTARGHWRYGHWACGHWGFGHGGCGHWGRTDRCWRTEHSGGQPG